MLVAGVLAMLLPAALVARAADTPSGRAPKTAPEATTLEGTVTSLQQPQNGGMVSFVLKTADNNMPIDLAPPLYLAKIGLTLTEGEAVKIDGVQLEKSNKKTGVTTTTFKLYSLLIGDKLYSFRKKGQELWNKVLEYPVLTLDGTVKDLTDPNAEPAVAPTTATTTATTATTESTTATPTVNSPKKPHGPQVVYFTLITDKGETYTVELLSAVALTQLGLTLKEGDQVALIGWQTNALGTKRKGKNAEVVHIRARDVTVGTKTYSLYDADGNKLVGAENTKHK
jgi:hypothetical protein